MPKVRTAAVSGPRRDPPDKPAVSVVTASNAEVGGADAGVAAVAEVGALEKAQLLRTEVKRAVASTLREPAALWASRSAPKGPAGLDPRSRTATTIILHRTARV